MELYDNKNLLKNDEPDSDKTEEIKISDDDAADTNEKIEEETDGENDGDEQEKEDLITSEEKNAGNLIEEDSETENLKKEVERQRNELERYKNLLDKQELELRDSSSDSHSFIPQSIERVFEDDLKKIKQVFPHVKANHITELGDKFMLLMSAGESSGIDAVDAYAATHRDEIFAQKEKQTRQRTINSISSKSHMKPTFGVGGKTAEVPKNVYDKYKRLIPGITDSEIRKHYMKSKDD